MYEYTIHRCIINFIRSVRNSLVKLLYSLYVTSYLLSRVYATGLSKQVIFLTTVTSGKKKNICFRQFVTLPVPDPNGYRIIFHRLADNRPNQYMFNDGIKLLAMSVDASLYSEGCSPGYVFLFDMRGVRLGHLTRLSVSSIRKFFEYLQEGLPVRLKGIHVLNAVWFMDKILSLIRPFMKRELFDMVRIDSL